MSISLRHLVGWILSTLGSRKDLVLENHPDTAKAMEKMHNDDPKKWGRETKPKWEATPET
jgi:hypothetical protein